MNRLARRAAAKVERAARRLQTARAVVEAGCRALAGTEQSEEQAFKAKALCSHHYFQVVRKRIHVPQRSALAVFSVDDDDREFLNATREHLEAQGEGTRKFYVPDDEVASYCMLYPIPEMVEKMEADPFWSSTDFVRMVREAPLDTMPIVYTGVECGSGVFVVDHPSTVDVDRLERELAALAVS